MLPTHLSAGQVHAPGGHAGRPEDVRAVLRVDDAHGAGDRPPLLRARGGDQGPLPDPHDGPHASTVLVIM